MSVRFALLTDSHYHPQAPEDYAAPKMLTRGREVLSAIPEAVNALSPDFVIHAGDLLCGGSSFALPTDLYEQSVDEVADAFAKIQAPFHCVPGNHDCDAQSGSFAGFARRFPLPDPLMIKEVAPRLRLALANIYHSCSSSEESSGIWTDALDASLRKAATQAAQDGAALLLVLHTWVLSDHTLNRGLVKNSERLVETISSHPAIAAVFTGHRHLNRIRMYRDFLVVDTSCLIGFPLGFRLVTLEDNGLFNTTFHTLPLTEINEASYARSTREENDRWQGEIHDRETEVFLPRLRQSWS